MTEQTKVTLPRGVSQEDYDIAKPIVVSGFENGVEKQPILQALFEQGNIEFSKLEKVFTAVAVDNGLIVSNEDIKTGIAAALKDADMKFSDYDALDSFVEETAENVNGATVGKVLAAIRVKAKAEEVDLPKKSASSKGTRGLTGLKAAIVTAFQSNDELSKEDMARAIRSAVKTDKNAVDYTNSWYAAFSAMASGIEPSKVEKAPAITVKDVFGEDDDEEPEAEAAA